MQPEQPNTAGGLDAETPALAHRMFDLARDGHTTELIAHVDAGLPADLTNDDGDTLLILAAHHGHPDTVAALPERAADPARLDDRGRTALATATFFDLPYLLELLQRRPQP